MPAAPADPIVGLNQTFADDPSTTKVLLGVGAYRDDAGKPYVLPSIREAESRVVNGNPNHEYAAITGDAEFVKLSLEFAYGPDSAPLVENRVAAAQVLSGTGGLRVCAQLIERLPRLTGSSSEAGLLHARADVGQPRQGLSRCGRRGQTLPLPGF